MDKILKISESDQKFFYQMLKKVEKGVLNNEYENQLDISIFDNFNPLIKLNTNNLKDKRIGNSLRRFYKRELQILINNTFNKEALFNILNDKPHVLYSFMFNLFTGTRINEFYRIRTEDILVHESNNHRIFYIWLNENYSKQSLKNENAHRNIIIPNILIDLGILNYINRRINKNEEWLWKQNASGYGSISTFYTRNIEKYLPEVAYNYKNKKKGAKNLLQFRCLRKNFVKAVESEQIRPPHFSELNLKKLIGHEESTSSGKYYGRIEPYAAKCILDSSSSYYNIKLEELKTTVKEYYKNIDIDIPTLEVEDEERWEEVSIVRPRTIR